MPLGLLEGLGLGLSGLGILGGLFDSEGGDIRPEQQQIYNMLMQRSKQGINPELLQAMRRRASGAVGEEFSGLSANTSARLRRQNAPMAKQEQIMDKLNTRRMGAKAGALTGIDALNEQTKMDYMRQLAGFGAQMGPEPLTGAGYGDLIGAGLGMAQQGLAQDEYFQQLNKIMSQGGGGKYEPASYRMDLLADIEQPKLRENRSLNSYYNK